MTFAPIDWHTAHAQVKELENFIYFGPETIIEPSLIISGSIRREQDLSVGAIRAKDLLKSMFVQFKGLEGIFGLTGVKNKDGKVVISSLKHYGGQAPDIVLDPNDVVLLWQVDRWLVDTEGESEHEKIERVFGSIYETTRAKDPKRDKVKATATAISKVLELRGVNVTPEALADSKRFYTGYAFDQGESYIYGVMDLWMSEMRRESGLYSVGIPPALRSGSPSVKEEISRSLAQEAEDSDTLADIVEALEEFLVEPGNQVYAEEMPSRLREKAQKIREAIQAPAKTYAPPVITKKEKPRPEPEPVLTEKEKLNRLYSTDKIVFSSRDLSMKSDADLRRLLAERLKELPPAGTLSAVVPEKTSMPITNVMGRPPGMSFVVDADNPYERYCFVSLNQQGALDGTTRYAIRELQHRSGQYKAPGHVPAVKEAPKVVVPRKKTELVKLTEAYNKGRETSPADGIKKALDTLLENHNYTSPRGAESQKIWGEVIAKTVNSASPELVKGPLSPRQFKELMRVWVNLVLTAYFDDVEVATSHARDLLSKLYPRIDYPTHRLRFEDKVSYLRDRSEEVRQAEKWRDSKGKPLADFYCTDIAAVGLLDKAFDEILGPMEKDKRVKGRVGHDDLMGRVQVIDRQAERNREEIDKYKAELDKSRPEPKPKPKPEPEPEPEPEPKPAPKKAKAMTPKAAYARVSALLWTKPATLLSSSVLSDVSKEDLQSARKVAAQEEDILTFLKTDR
jgi:hypothetical protein